MTHYSTPYWEKRYTIRDEAAGEVYEPVEWENVLPTIKRIYAEGLDDPVPTDGLEDDEWGAGKTFGELLEECYSGNPREAGHDVDAFFALSIEEYDEDDED